VILRLRGRSVLPGSGRRNGKEAVAGGIDFAPAVATEEPANERVMASMTSRQLASPTSASFVVEADDVGERDGGKHCLRFSYVERADKSLELRDDRRVRLPPPATVGVDSSRFRA
jgi:hypothetical protein